MKKIFIKPLLFIALVLCTAGLLITFYRAGCVVDEYGVLYNADKWPMYSLWFALFLSVGALGILYALRCKDYLTGKKHTYVLAALAIAVVFYSVYAVIDANYELNRTVQMFDEPEHNPVQVPALQSSSLEHIDSFFTEKENAIVFITRDSCPDCEICEAGLAELLAEYPAKIWKYNTNDDRDMRKDYMSEILAKYKVETVPTIAVIKNGKIAEHFSGENVLKDFEEYCSNEF